MAYTSGDQILANHYNDFANQINAVWGTGTGNAGYGQANTIPVVTQGPTVSPTSTISATQWATLLARISSMASHQGSTITPITNPTAGSPVSALAALQSNVDTVITNRLNANASGTDITTGGVGERVASWVNEIVMTYTITFPSVNAARFFFNAGGMIRMTFSRTGGTAHAKNADWSALCTACGAIALTGGNARTVAGTAYTGANKLGGSGTPAILNPNIGYFNYTTSNQTLFRQNSADPIYLYGGSGNRIVVEGRGNVAAPANILTITVRFVDGAPDTSPIPLDIVDGTLRTNLVLRPPSTTHIANSWGTPTISVNVAGN